MQPGYAEAGGRISRQLPKATQNGEDLASPLIEQAATQVLTAITQPAAPDNAYAFRSRQPRCARSDDRA